MSDIGQELVQTRIALAQEKLRHEDTKKDLAKANALILSDDAKWARLCSHRDDMAEYIIAQQKWQMAQALRRLTIERKKRSRPRTKKGAK